MLTSALEITHLFNNVKMQQQIRILYKIGRNLLNAHIWNKLNI